MPMQDRRRLALEVVEVRGEGADRSRIAERHRHRITDPFCQLGSGRRPLRFGPETVRVREALQSGGFSGLQCPRLARMHETASSRRHEASRDRRRGAIRIHASVNRIVAGAVLVALRALMESQVVLIVVEQPSDAPAIPSVSSVNGHRLRRARNRERRHGQIQTIPRISASRMVVEVRMTLTRRTSCNEINPAATPLNIFAKSPLAELRPGRTCSQCRCGCGRRPSVTALHSSRRTG